MPWNGSGVYSVPYNWTNDAANGIKILASRQDGQWSDLVTAMNNVICRDGQATITANLPMAGFRHTNVGNGAAKTDYLALGQLKTNAILYCGAAGGTADALTATTSPVNTALTDGMIVFVKAASANATTTPTFVLDSIGSALTITKAGGSALVAGDIRAAGHELLLMYSATGTRWELLNPASAGTVTGLSIAAGKTLTVSNTITFTATDGSTLAIGAGGTLASAAYVATGTSGATIPLLNGTNTWSAAQTLSATAVLSAGANNTPATTPATNAVGYLGIPDSAGSGVNSYTAVMADAGCMIRINGTSKTATIPANGTVAYPVGTALTFINQNSSALSIAITTDTMTLANSTTTGTRTLAQNGVATAVKMTSTTWLISGTGLT